MSAVLRGRVFDGIVWQRAQNDGGQQAARYYGECYLQKCWNLETDGQTLLAKTIERMSNVARRLTFNELRALFHAAKPPSAKQ